MKVSRKEIDILMAYLPITFFALSLLNAFLSASNAIYLLIFLVMNLASLIYFLFAAHRRDGKKSGSQSAGTGVLLLIFSFIAFPIYVFLMRRKSDEKAV